MSTVVSSRPTTAAFVVRATVSHQRRRPFAYDFEHRITAWLVDAADPNAAFPRRLRGLVRIDPDDHFSDRTGDLLTRVRGWIADQGLAWSADTIRMLVNARTAGYVFDPLTTYFCFDAGGALEGIVAEVHNTYGGQHAYAVSTAATRRGTSLDKAFYVSPFFTVEGRYHVRARLTDDQVAVSIALHQDGEQVFSGAVHGPLLPATRAAVLRAVLRNPFASQRVAALIRWHGIRLWLRRLPVVPRTPVLEPADSARKELHEHHSRT